MELRALIRKFIILVFIVFPSISFATDYYVRPAPGSYGASDGSSYAAAWDGLTNINWATVDAGNGKLFVCGTFSGESKYIGTSGEEGTPIQIVNCTVANGASADDPGVLDGNDAVELIFTLDTVSYVTIDGLTFQNPSDGGANPAGMIQTQGGSNIILKNLTIDSDRGRAIRMSSGTDNSLIQNCNLSAGSEVTADTTQADVIYMGGGGSNNVIDGCKIVQEGYGGHIDGYQNAGEVNLTIKNSYIEDLTGTDGDQTVIVENNTGTFTMYNCVIVSGANVTSTGSFVIGNNGSGWTAAISMWNNTIIHKTTSASGSALNLPGALAGLITLKNNIMYIPNGWAVRIPQGVTTKANVNNNLLYTTNADVAYTSEGRTWAEWQSDGYDASGVNSDPLFNVLASNDLTLTSSSPAIGAGADLGNSLLYGLDPTTTWADNVKPVDQDAYGDWEIGAFVYIEAAELGGPGTIPGGGLGSIPGGGLGSIVGTEP